MERIFWASRHSPTASQISALEGAFGDVLIVPYVKRITRADSVIEALQRSSCDELVIVAPEKIFFALSSMGIKPIYPVMAPCSPDEAESTRWGGQPIKFLRYSRIVQAEIVRKPLTGGLFTKRVKKCLWLSDVRVSAEILSDLRSKLGRNLNIVEEFAGMKRIPQDLDLISSRIEAGNFDAVVVKLSFRLVAQLMNKFPRKRFITHYIRYPNGGEEPNYRSKRGADLVVDGFNEIVNLVWEQRPL